MVKKLLLVLPITATLLSSYAAATFHKEMQNQKERAMVAEAEFDRLNTEDSTKEAACMALNTKANLIQTKLETTIIYCYSKPECVQPDREY